MLDTYNECWNRVLLRCPTVSPKLAQDFIVNAFRRLAERKRWSWLVKQGQFITPDVYLTGTVAVTNGSNLVTGTNTVWTNAMVGRQFRVGLAAPIYTIQNVISSTSMELDQPFGGPTSASTTYNIYQCFFTVPEDFHQFITVYDVAFNWRLLLDISQDELNIVDAQRANVGNPYVVSFRDYTRSQNGLVASALQVVGSGNDPVFGGTFTGPTDAVFTVEITTGGISGTAVFKWKKNDGTYTTLVTTDALGAAQDLMDGVTVAFPTPVTYTVGDVFICNVYAIPNSGLPRYELWPHQQTQKVYPFLYESRPIDIDDPGATIPRYIRGDVLVEMALEDLALWPGPSPDKPNPYFSERAASYHGSKAETMINTLERQDDEVWVQLISYQYAAVSWALATPLGDSSWLQRHAI